MDKEEQLFCKRIKELANASFNREICTYTDFLNLNEISLFYHIEKELPNLSYHFFGGFQEAERKKLCFSPIESYQEVDYSIDCIVIKPKDTRFCDSLTHRDFLGAIINLGITRNKIGDILVCNNAGTIFCDSKISTFIKDSLMKIKHTTVTCMIQDAKDITYVPAYEEINRTVSSLRLDCMIAAAFQSSRSSLAVLIGNGKVYVNSRLVLTNSYMLQDNDIVSVRGLGKFRYKETNKQTKKGRYSITLLKYC